ncbi:threonylcarbamoyl-AMP synthase [Candidatus Uhrbacteria bacterium]|nr:threonylcarbamoyl-AMP synthase [Candidatus Uhrbacteria bacterium]
MSRAKKIKPIYSNKIASILKEGGVGVLPTDTLYGIVGSTRIPQVVKRIYEIRKRDQKKPCIVLIASLKSLEEFGIHISPARKKTLQKLWPGPVSVIFPCRLKKYQYLHRGTKTLAFRMPADERLRKLLQRTGPLVAPSANIAGKPPARSLLQAKFYFKNALDFYVAGEKQKNQSSTLISFKGKKIEIKRKGVSQIPY